MKTVYREKKPMSWFQTNGSKLRNDGAFADKAKRILLTFEMTIKPIPKV